MDKSWLFIGVLVLAGLLGLVLKQWFLVPGKPLRDWYDARIAPHLKKAVLGLLYLTLAVWIITWALADDADRKRLPDEVKAFFKSIEFGQGSTPESPGK